jgi:hypothetical protein
MWSDHNYTNHNNDVDRSRSTVSMAILDNRVVYIHGWYDIGHVRVHRYAKCTASVLLGTFCVCWREPIHVDGHHVDWTTMRGSCGGR